jgi:hypothetical protein
MTDTRDRVGPLAVAKLLGVGTTILYKARPYLPGFPACEQVGKKKFYSLAAVKAWTKGKDVKALIREGEIKYRLSETAAEQGRAELLNLSRRFHSGEFDTAEQRYFHSVRRWTARDRQPQTTRISIRPEWSL